MHYSHHHSLCIVHSALCIALALATASARADDFRAALRARSAEVAENALPAPITPRPNQYGLSLKNIGDRALRGSLEFHTAKADGRDARCEAKAELDLPPPSVSDAAQALVLKGELKNSDIGRTARIVARIPGGDDIVCFSGVVAEDAGKTRKRAEAAAKATSAAGGRHDIRYAERLPAGEGELYRAFIEAGGVLIVRLVTCREDYAGAAAFCGEEALLSFRPQKGPAHNQDLDVRTGATPLFDWPHRLSPTLQAGDGRLGNGGAAGKVWESVQEGYTYLMRVGKGLLIVSTHTVADTKEMREDVARQLALEEGGFRLHQFSQEYEDLDEYKGKVPFPAIGGGKTVVKVRNANFATTNLNLAARLTIAEKRKGGQSRTFVARAKESRKIGDTITLEIQVPPFDINGACHAKTEIFDWNTKRAWTLDESDVTFPDLFVVTPPAYRGWVSTKRRESDVFAGVRFCRRGFNAEGGTWRLVARDAKGAVVAKDEGVFAPGSAAAEARLPVPADAPAGVYALEGEATLPDGAAFQAKGSFEIVAPEKGQIMVDQDGFWLQEGEPFFPLGTYHCHVGNWREPIDDTGLRACDMGFNWMQMWDWDWRGGLCLDREIADSFIDKNLQGAEREAAIDARLVTNAANRAAMQGVALCLEGFGVWGACLFEQPGEWGTYSFERSEKMAREVRIIAEEPDQLVRMWYCSDEAGGNMYRPLSRVARRYAALDVHRYPTFNLGNVPAVMAGDVGGNDIYVRYYGGLGSAAFFANRVESIRRSLAPFRRRPFIVPQAFGQSERQPSETPEWVRVETYLCVIHGACGIGFYCWKQTGDWSGKEKQGMGWNPPTAHEVKKLIAEVKTFQGALMSGQTEFLKSDDGNVHALLCGDAASGRFLIVANTLEDAVKTEIGVKGLDSVTLEPLFGAPSAKVRKGTLPLALPSWGTAVWRVN